MRSRRARRGRRGAPTTCWPSQSGIPRRRSRGGRGTPGAPGMRAAPRGTEGTPRRGVGGGARGALGRSRATARRRRPGVPPGGGWPAASPTRGRAEAAERGGRRRRRRGGGRTRLTRGSASFLRGFEGGKGPTGQRERADAKTGRAEGRGVASPRVAPGSNASALSCAAPSARCESSSSGSAATGATRYGRRVLLAHRRGRGTIARLRLNRILRWSSRRWPPRERGARGGRDGWRGALRRRGHAYDQRLEEVEFMRSACAQRRGATSTSCARRSRARRRFEMAPGAQRAPPFTTPLARASLACVELLLRPARRERATTAGRHAAASRRLHRSVEVVRAARRGAVPRADKPTPRLHTQGERGRGRRGAPEARFARGGRRGSRQGATGGLSGGTAAAVPSTSPFTDSSPDSAPPAGFATPSATAASTHGRPRFRVGPRAARETDAPPPPRALPAVERSRMPPEAGRAPRRDDRLEYLPIASPRPSPPASPPPPSRPHSGKPAPAQFTAPA